MTAPQRLGDQTRATSSARSTVASSRAALTRAQSGATWAAIARAPRGENKLPSETEIETSPPGCAGDEGQSGARRSVPRARGRRQRFLGPHAALSGFRRLPVHCPSSGRLGRDRSPADSRRSVPVSPARRAAGGGGRDPANGAVRFRPGAPQSAGDEPAPLPSGSPRDARGRSPCRGRGDARVPAWLRLPELAPPPHSRAIAGERRTELVSAQPGRGPARRPPRRAV